MNVSIHNGWYQVAYERDLKEALNAASLGDRRIALCRQQDGITAIDAYCPHRGAHLCHGGSLGEDYVVCPFHGFKIGLRRPIGGFQAEAYETMMVGGLVFVKIPGGADCGLRAELLALDATHFIVPGFEMLINAPASLVIENAFDATHFHPVHRVMKPPCFTSRRGAHGSYEVEGSFQLPPSPWQTTAGAGGTEVPFTAAAFSPTIVLSQLGGPKPYAMLTATQPLGERQCRVRLSLLLPAGADHSPPSVKDCQYLLHQAQAGIEQDVPIWENMRWPLCFTPVESDQGPVGFQVFCQEFHEIPAAEPILYPSCPSASRASV